MFGRCDTSSALEPLGREERPRAPRLARFPRGQPARRRSTSARSADAGTPRAPNPAITADREVGEHGVPPLRLACEDVGEVHLDEGDLHREERIAQGQAGVRRSAAAFTTAPSTRPRSACTASTSTPS